MSLGKEQYYRQLCFKVNAPRLSVFAAQCYASAAYAIMRCPSVCVLSVCPSRSYILSKQIFKDLQTIFHRRAAKPF